MGDKVVSLEDYLFMKGFRGKQQFCLEMYEYVLTLPNNEQYTIDQCKRNITELQKQIDGCDEVIEKYQTIKL